MDMEGVRKVKSEDEKVIDGKTRVLGVIGCPIEHTKSPAIHNMLAENMGLNLAYVPFRVEKGAVGDAIKGAFALGILGLNVTVPHKSEVIDSLIDIDPLAKQIGAVNTLVRKENGYKGYNTDMPGLLRAMKSDGVELEGREVVILGAGGVARAVAMMLAKNGAACIYMYNRTVEKAKAIAEEVNSIEGKELVKYFALDELGKLQDDRKYLCIQTTNVGMYPECDKALVEDMDFYRKIDTAYDLIFNPLETRFMTYVKEAGGESFNGLKMLLYQGIIAYELWTGETVTEELAGRVYQSLLANFDKN